MVERLARSYVVSEQRAFRVFYVFQERPTAIEATLIQGLNCGCVSARLLREECGTDAAKSAYC